MFDINNPSVFWTFFFINNWCVMAVWRTITCYNSDRAKHKRGCCSKAQPTTWLSVFLLFKKYTFSLQLLLLLEQRGEFCSWPLSHTNRMGIKCPEKLNLLWNLKESSVSLSTVLRRRLAPKRLRGVALAWPLFSDARGKVSAKTNTAHWAADHTVKCVINKSVRNKCCLYVFQAFPLWL